MKAGRFIACIALTAGACVHYTPPAFVPVRQPTPIAAPFDSTWAAVISFFAENNISIKTIEKASGFIVAERGSFNVANRAPALDQKGRQRKDQYGNPLVGDAIYGDCGRTNYAVIDPWTATFNIHVQGNGTASTVQTNIFFHAMQSYAATAAPAQCVSKGRWEQALESSIRKRLKLAEN